MPDTADDVQVYRSSLGAVIWWLWAAFALANLIDLAVQGRDHLSAEAAAVLLLITGIAYTCALRPRVIAAVDGITVRNPLRDHQVGWPAVTQVELCDLLRVHCARPAGGRDRVISAWAIQSSRRAQTSAAARSAAAGSMLGRRSVGGTSARAPSPGALHRAEANRIAEALNDRAQRETADTARVTGAPAVISQWRWPAVLSVALPVALLIGVVLS